MASQDYRLAYAPTPYSFTPNTTSRATIDLDQEVRLSESSAERDLFDSLAELYSIIVTLDGLEKAYIRDSVSETDYTELCTRLLKQYKSSLSNEQVSEAFGDIETFQKKWSMDCPRAAERLRVNIPATVADPHYAESTTPIRPDQGPRYMSQYMGHMGPSVAAGSQILTATENFITFLDALKLNLLSKKDLHPLLAEVIQSVNQVTQTDFEGRAIIVKWLIKLNAMKAQDVLAEDEARELGFEIEQAYRGFKSTLT